MPISSLRYAFAFITQNPFTHWLRLCCKLLVFHERWMHSLWLRLWKRFIQTSTSDVIIIIIIKICSAHISTLLGAQGAETEKKTWIQTIYNDSKNNIMCRAIHVQYNYKYTCISSFKNCDIRWVLSSDLNLVLLLQDLSLVGRWFQYLDCEWLTSPSIF